MDQHYNLHILLIDDDDDDKELFREALKEITPDSIVTTATSCNELLKNIDNLNTAMPDMIFLDLNMPKMDGFECLDLIKSLHPLNNIPVFIYSTSVNPAHTAITYEKGASMFFQKPPTFEGIKGLVKKVMSLSRESYFPQTAWEDYLVKFPVSAN